MFGRRSVLAAVLASILMLEFANFGIGTNSNFKFPSWVQQAEAQALQLIVSAAQPPFQNHFFGSQIVRIITNDPGATRPDSTTVGETVKQTELKRVHLKDGLWYSFIASSKEFLQLADVLSDGKKDNKIYINPDTTTFTRRGFLAANFSPLTITRGGITFIICNNLEPTTACPALPAGVKTFVRNIVTSGDNTFIEFDSTLLMSLPAAFSNTGGPSAGFNPDVNLTNAVAGKSDWPYIQLIDIKKSDLVPIRAGSATVNLTFAPLKEWVSAVKRPLLKQPFVPGGVLVVLKKSTDPNSTQVRAMIEAQNGTIIEVLKEINLVRIAVSIGTEKNVAQQLQKNEIVEFAKTNDYLVPTSIVMTDPEYYLQFNHYTLINVPDAWKDTTGSDQVIVAVIDSGIDLNHPDLKANISKDKGRNFVQNNDPPMDTEDQASEPFACLSHGTHVSGIIAAINNDIGGLGVAPNVKIIPLKVATDIMDNGQLNCVAKESDIDKAVAFAVEHDAKIINVSLGCAGGPCGINSVGTEFQKAHDKGVLVVVGAGNDNGPDDWENYEKYVIEVSSVELWEEHASYSNFGRGVKLSAPGTEVYSTILGGTYTFKTGTSQAAPMVSGCAALLLSANPSLTNADIEKILTDSAKDLGDKGRDNLFGYGLLDCGKAVEAVPEFPVVMFVFTAIVAFALIMMRDRINLSFRK